MGRITRDLATSNEELRRELEAFDPFTASRSIPRGDSAEEINSITSPKKKVKDSKITMATSGTIR